MFNYVTGYVRPEGLEKLAISPHMIKPRILEGLAAEIEHARAGRPAQVWVKLNAITEPEVIDALYAASQAGVKIDMVVRGICGLRAGVAGLSENIRVKSIIGRFLEHSRIVCFGNGHGLPSTGGAGLHQLGRLDGAQPDRGGSRRWSRSPTRRCTRRSSTRSWRRTWPTRRRAGWRSPTAATCRHDAEPGEQLFSCHRFFMENPSLSGRGRAGARDVIQLVHGHD